MSVPGAPGPLEMVNQMACKYLGYSKEELSRFNPLDLVAPESRKDAEDCMASLQPGVPAHFERSMMTKDGRHIPVELNSHLLDIEGKPYVLAILHEIGERKRMEAERENLIQELRQALEEVKTLEGILPTCAYCKRIRDDQGEWHQFEFFIRERSEAEFSHGICPECLKNQRAF
jgi:PAS domain S-box-containing protein